jgi:chromosome segregation ATPase
LLTLLTLPQHPMKDWLLNASIALVTGCGLGLLIDPGAALSIALICGLTSVGSFLVVTRIQKLRLDKTGKSLQSRIYYLQTKQQALDLNIQEAEAQKFLMQQEVVNNQDRVSALEAARKRIENETKTVEIQLIALRSEQERLQATVDQTTVDFQKIVGNADAVVQRKVLLAEMDERERQQQSLTASVLVLTESIAILTTEKAQITEQQHSLQIQVVELQSQEVQLQQSLQHLQTQATELSIVQKHLLELHQEREQLQESIEWLRTDRDQIIGQSQSQVQELSEKEQVLQLSVQDLQQAAAKFDNDQEKIGALYKEWQQLEDAMEILAAKKTALDNEIADIQPSVKLLEQSREQLMYEVTELTAQRNRFNQANIETPSTIMAPELAIPQSERGANTAWQDQFEDENIRAVFEHLYEYGSLTEAELTQMLEGNPRKARQFALKFEEYLLRVPFSARVEVGSNGKRYVRS